MTLIKLTVEAPARFFLCTFCFFLLSTNSRRVSTATPVTGIGKGKEDHTPTERY